MKSRQRGAREVYLIHVRNWSKYNPPTEKKIKWYATVVNSLDALEDEIGITGSEYKIWHRILSKQAEANGKEFRLDLQKVSKRWGFRQQSVRKALCKLADGKFISKKIPNHCKDLQEPDPTLHYKDRDNDTEQKITTSGNQSSMYDARERDEPPRNDFAIKAAVKVTQALLQFQNEDAPEKARAYLGPFVWSALCELYPVDTWRCVFEAYMGARGRRADALFRKDLQEHFAVFLAEPPHQEVAQ